MGLFNTPFRFNQSTFNTPRRDAFSFEVQPRVDPRDTVTPRTYNFNMPIEEDVEDVPESPPVGIKREDRGNAFNFPDFTNMQEPQYPVMSRFMQALESRPQREDYKPGFLNNLFGAIGGVGAGLSGKSALDVAGTTDTLRYMPYGRAVSDWEKDTSHLGKAAELENNQVEGKNKWLTLVGNLAASAERLNQGNARIGQGDTRLEQSADRLKLEAERQAANIKRQEAMGKAIVRSSGRVWAWDKANNTMLDMGEDMGSTYAGVRAATGERNAATAERRADIASVMADVAQGRLTVAQAMAQVAQQNANTGEFRADIAAFNAQTGADRLTDSQRRTEEFVRNSISNRTINEERAAREGMTGQGNYNLAVQQVLTENPEFREFFDDEGNLLPDAGDDDDYRVFLDRVEDKARRRRRDITPSGPAAPPPPTRTAPTRGGPRVQLPVRRGINELPPG